MFRFQQYGYSPFQDIIEEVIQVTQGGAHGVLVMSSSPKAYEQALGYVRKAGTLVCIGISKPPIQSPIWTTD